MKKRNIIIVIFFCLCICTAILLNMYSPKEEAKKNTKGFLTAVFNSPDPELNEMFTKIFTSADQIPEDIDIGKRMKDLFYPNFTDSSLDKSIAVWSTFGPIFEGTEWSSTIKQNTIKVSQSKKEKAEMDFYGTLEYGKNKENYKSMEISGSIRYDRQNGKLNYFRFSLDTQRGIADMQRSAKEDADTGKSPT